MIVWGWVEWRRLQAGEVFRTNAPAGGSAGWTQRGGGVYVSFNVKEVWWVREPGLSNEFQRDHCCSADWVCPELKTHRRWAHELRAGRAVTAAAPCGFWLAMRFLWRCAAQTRRWNDSHKRAVKPLGAAVGVLSEDKTVKVTELPDWSSQLVYIRVRKNLIQVDSCKNPKLLNFNRFCRSRSFNHPTEL